TNRESRYTALRLCRLAGIADNEWVDHRQRTGDDLGKAGPRQRHRLARQPFECAVSAHVEEPMRPALLQPQPERNERVPRRQPQIVVISAPMLFAAAIGWQPNQDLADGGAPV